MSDKTICDNCEAVISYNHNHPYYYTVSAHGNKSALPGAFAPVTVNYDFCGLNCLNEFIAKGRLVAQ